MKIVKIAIVAIVIIGALLFIYMKVVYNAKPIEAPAEDPARAKLEQTIQSMSPNVDPQDRRDLESFMGKKFPSEPATEAN